MGARYWYILDPELALVQVFGYGIASGRGHGRTMCQFVSYGGKNRLIASRFKPTTMPRLAHEAGFPPLAYVNEIISRPKSEQCIYCGKNGLYEGLVNAYSLPLYTPRAQTCDSCGKATVVL